MPSRFEVLFVAVAGVIIVVAAPVVPTFVVIEGLNVVAADAGIVEDTVVVACVEAGVLVVKFPPPLPTLVCVKADVTVGN